MKLIFEIKGKVEFVDENEKSYLCFTIETQDRIRMENVNMLVLPIDQKVRASVQPVDAKGNPADIEGECEWTSSSDAIATVDAEEVESQIAWVVPVAIGTCQINVTADADIGEGVTTITGVLDVEVVAGQAVGFTISTEAPIPQ